MITRSENATLGKLTLNRRQAIEDLEASGQILISWEPE